MRRVLFRWRGLSLYAYPTFLYIGLVTGVIAGHIVARRSGLDADRITLASLLLIIPALVGSRLFYVLLHWQYFARARTRMLSPSNGGAALYGGLMLSLALSVPLLYALSLPLGKFWDIAIVTILIGMMFTKMGCLLNGCCGGRPSTSRFALWLPDARGVWRRRVPTQLLEAALAGVLLAVVAVVWSDRPFDGAAFLIAAAGYGAGRSALEAMRDTIDRVGRMRVHQAISAALAAASLAMLFTR
jgi:phosphatidylglycerol:prolipoprotein diacylglycerol transferase